MTKYENKAISLTLSKLNCQIPNYESEISSLKIVNDDPLYDLFVQQFLAYIAVDYNFKDRQKLFCNFAQDAFKFFKQKHTNKRKIQITNTVIEDNPAINILILNDDKCFIVDSIICLLTSLNLKAKFLLNPVINCIRNNDGQLCKISDIDVNSHVESLVHITILGDFNQQSINSLEQALNNVFDKVDITENIKAKLLNRVTHLSNEMHDNQQLYKNNNFDYNESIDFLKWLKNDNFIFLGMIDFDVTSHNFSSEDGITGIWRDVVNDINNIIDCSASSLYQNQLIILGAVNTISRIHKGNLVDYILVKKIDSNGAYTIGSIIFGLYNSAIEYQSVMDIPILRQKLQFVLDKVGFPNGGHNTKKITNIIQSLPKRALIQVDQGDLYCICLHTISSMMSRKLKLFIQQDWSSLFINIIIFLPRERLTLEVHGIINLYLSDKFNSKILSDHIVEVEEDSSYLFVTIEVQNKSIFNFEIDIIEQELNKLSTNWTEDFYHSLCQKFGEYQGGVNFKLFSPMFSIGYKEKFNGETSLIDIEYLKKASDNKKLTFNLIAINSQEFHLKIYSPTPKLSLSELLPPIENLGFKVIDEQSFIVKETLNIKESWIYVFALDAPMPIEGDMDLIKINIEEALDKIFLGILGNDSLSKLIVLSSFTWCKVKLMKALTRYLHQTGFTYSDNYVQSTLIQHFLYSKMLLDLFDAKFNPKNSSDKQFNMIKNTITSYLNTVNSSSEDKVLRNMSEVIEAIVRTNFYQSNINEGCSNKNYFSFKFNSSKVPDLPLPIPYAEIFVYANDFEAIHLRGGKVARGGIRWSDRGEDYRVEVLGLMKAQMTKNSVIVPVGSKGGFFINFTDENLSRIEYMEKVIQCYKNFLRGLLDITDNIVDGKIIQPSNTVIYDLQDPYLVVAADKGTATFSDHANSVSAEYNFWLGDAFASGGSAGYDHKKMAITSKGAWISVTNHFHTMGINVQEYPITVVGIGDMSGDVFGNGMLMSKTIKLVAAFNHKHIFIDPMPDAIISFNERLRLFALPTSSWIDYNPSLISKGGGVFERSCKSISLSLEAKALLKLDANELSPENLIKAILLAEVDLLWNGGIGTYIKASIENNIEIDDKSNDALRVNGLDVKAKVIGEGGNVGVSQLGRIEYSKCGGLINTDFIDNSGGVDCSDHEVNIKIALNQAVFAEKISLEERNEFLLSMTKQVEKLVLTDNYQQNQAINMMQLSTASPIEIFSQFIDTLEEAKLVDRAIEFLPSKAELNKRSINKENLTRPELCVILSYSKSWAYHDLLTTTFSQDEYFESYLINYFPKSMQEKFREEILSHPLKYEIIRTVVTNKIINQLGGTAIDIIKRQTGATFADIIRSYIIICEIFDLENLWNSVEFLPNTIDYKIKADMFTELAKIMRRGICWFITHTQRPINISNIIAELSEPAKSLSQIIGNCLLGEAKVKFDDKIKGYTLSNVPSILAYSIATLDSLISAFDIIYTAKETKFGNSAIANLYFAIGNKFSIDWLRKCCDQQLNDSYWNRLATQSIKDDLYDKQRRLLTKIIMQSKIIIDLDLWSNDYIDDATIFLDFINKIKSNGNVDLNILILANKKLETFICKLG